MNRKNIDAEKTSVHMKKVMDEKGVSTTDVANSLGVSAEAVYKWINSKNTVIPDIDHLVGLSNLLDVSIDDLIVRKHDNRRN